MKALMFVVIVAGLLASACGDQDSVTSPSSSTAHGAKQTDSSTVSILD